MIELNTNNNPRFCPNKKFQKDVIDILCNSLFVSSTVSLIEDVYRKMNGKINDIDASLLYPMEAGTLKSGIDIQNICQNGNIYAGHDLPVWLGDPCGADIKIMVISQDPRRNDSEMHTAGITSNSGGIALSTPFGLHSIKWRSDKNKGLVHYIFTEMIQDYTKFGKSLSVYYTDMYKLRWVDSLSNSKNTPNFDIANKDLYLQILMKEINLFNPSMVLLLGKEAYNIFASLQTDKCYKEVPHPSSRVRLKTWQKYFPEITSCKTEEKKQCIKDMINKLLISPQGQ